VKGLYTVQGKGGQKTGSAVQIGGVSSVGGKKGTRS